MRHRRRPQRQDEPNLFSPSIAVPDWRSLPPEVQLEIRALLVQMLRPSRKAATARYPLTEVASE